jgi:spore maturation protein SpmB
VKKLISDIYLVSTALFKVMIPVIIIVKIAEILGLVFWLTILLEPVLKFIGLPAEMALGLTTTVLTNPYAGLLVFASTPETMQLTVAQTTILASFMLFTHSLVLEAAISSKAGLRAITTIILRLFSGLLFCAILHWVFVFF